GRWDAETARTTSTKVAPWRIRRRATQTQRCETQGPKRRTTDTPTCRASKESASNSNAASENCAPSCAMRAAGSLDRRHQATDARHTNRSAWSTATRRTPDAEREVRLRLPWAVE